MPASKYLINSALATASFAAILDPSSLNGKNGFKISGEASTDLVGGSVASAGDVNGDGFDDVIVGAKGADQNGQVSGASYVVFGKAGGFLADLKLTTLNGKNGFQISGEVKDEWSGTSVASAGDINGDGFDDLIIGAPATYSTTKPGAAYVVYGKAALFPANLKLSALNGANGFQISGEVKEDRVGSSVASAGDINHDGFADLLIGASGAGAHGAAYVVFGKAAHFPADFKLSSLAGGNGFQINGEEGLGRSVASAGDINGDGFDDLILGQAFSSSPGGYSSGRSYLVFGKRTGFSAELNLSSLNGKTGFQINGESSYDYSGVSVSSAGDVNGDGFDDMIIGAFGGNVNAPYCGASYIVLGKSGIWPAEIPLNSTTTIKMNGGGSGDESGRAVGAAGDVNGDGFDDVIIGAPFTDSKGSLSGSSYVVFGGPHAPVQNLNLSTLTGKNGFQLRGAAASDESGRAVAGAGDVNEDGFDDVIVGSPHAKNGNLLSAGASYVVFGQAIGPITRVGTGADEFFAGGKFIDNLSGAGGHDRLLGNGGKDTLSGGPSGDLLTGGLNADRLTGGTGGDRFIYLLKADSVPSDPDTIADFKSAEGDLIDLARVDAIQATSPNNAFTFIGSEVFHGKAGELRFSGGILAGDTDGNKVPDISIKVHVTGSFGDAQIVN